MVFDLDVDSAALRHAADLLAVIAQDCRIHHPPRLPPMSDGALGASSLARETQARAQQRAAEAFEVADGLGDAAQDLAGRVLAAAAAFEETETIGRGGR